MYVKVVDADDYLDSTILKQYLVFLDGVIKNGHLPDLVLSGSVKELPSGLIVSRILPSDCHGDILTIEEFNDYSLCVLPSVTFRFNLLRNMNYRQTEGICYTDVEWTKYPLAVCHNFTCFPYELYHYLIGRQGQSMSRIQLGKNLWMLEKVALNLLSRLPKVLVNVSETHRRFVMQNVWNEFVNLYKIAIYGSAKGLYDDQLRVLDSKLMTDYPELFEYIGNACVYSTFAPYRFVLDWRNNSKLLRLKLLCARIKTAVLRRINCLVKNT